MYRRTEAPRRVFSAQTARSVRTMMASVFDRGPLAGSARKLQVPGFEVGGKSGTAHKYDPKSGGYHSDRYLSSFAGLAPIDEPVIALLVIVDEPESGQHFGAQVAGPVWTQIVSEALPHLGVSMTAEPRVADASVPFDVVEDLRGSRLDPSVYQPGVVPDFSGLGVARALQLARDRRLLIEVSGSGRAVRQQPRAGSGDVDQVIRIEFGRWQSGVSGDVDHGSQ